MDPPTSGLPIVTFTNMKSKGPPFPAHVDFRVAQGFLCVPGSKVGVNKITVTVTVTVTVCRFIAEKYDKARGRIPCLEALSGFE